MLRHRPCNGAGPRRRPARSLLLIHRRAVGAPREHAILEPPGIPEHLDEDQPQHDQCRRDQQADHRPAAGVGLVRLPGLPRLSGRTWRRRLRRWIGRNEIHWHQSQTMPPGSPFASPCCQGKRELGARNGYHAQRSARTPAMTEAYICDGLRTPFGRYGGALSGIRTDDLAALPLKALIARHERADWAALDDVIYGCANQAGEDNRNVARMAVLLAGLPVSVPGATINRLCGSGLDAVLVAARAIKAGEAGLIVAGGVESMTRAPFVMPKADSAFSRSAEVFDTTIGWRFVNPALKQKYGVDSMPETGENVAADYKVSREDQDKFALRSQQRTAAAYARGFFDAELIPVEIPQRKAKPLVISRDEHPRPETTLEQLAKLPTPFRVNGTVTAGNASGVNDGACALVIASDT